jgi:hypothetical protein
LRIEANIIENAIRMVPHFGPITEVSDIVNQNVRVVPAGEQEILIFVQENIENRRIVDNSPLPPRRRGLFLDLVVYIRGIIIGISNPDSIIFRTGENESVRTLVPHRSDRAFVLVFNLSAFERTRAVVDQLRFVDIPDFHRVICRGRELFIG